MQFRHHKITAFHPEANGQVERFNGQLKETLRKIVDSEENWDEFISAALFAYRTHYKDVIGTTPCMMECGRKLNYGEESEEKDDPEEYLNQLLNKMPIIWAEGQQKIVIQKEKDKQRHRVTPKQFKVGDEVMLYDERARGLENKWREPYTIEKVYDNGAYALELLNNRISTPINGNRLKLYKRREFGEPMVVIDNYKI